MKLTSLPAPATITSPATKPVQDRPSSQTTPLARAVDAIRADSRDDSQTYLDETIALHGGE
jgi:hypothetical protein